MHTHLCITNTLSGTRYSNSFSCTPSDSSTPFRPLVRAVKYRVKSVYDALLLSDYRAREPLRRSLSLSLALIIE